MRIVFCEFHPSGGLFHFSYQLAQALADAGNRVELVTGPEPELASKVPGFDVVPLFRTWHPRGADLEQPLLRRARRVTRAVRYLDAWRRLLSYLERDDVDAVVWSEFKTPIVGWFVARLARRPRRPVLAFVAHEPRPLAGQRTDGPLYHRGGRRGRALAFRNLDVTFVLGEGARQQLLEAWPQVRRVEVVPHGNQNVFAGGPVTAPDRCPPTAVFFGTWTRSKGLDVLLEAFAIVRRRLPEARLVIAGAVANVDAEGLRRRADAIGGIELRPGYVPVPDVAPLIGQARLVVIPYVRAAQSGVVHLAQTFARPVVATAVGDIPQAVRDGVCGRLVPPGDAVAFADAMVELLRDPARATAMGVAGRDRLATEASWDQTADRVARALADARVGPGARSAS